MHSLATFYEQLGMFAWTSLDATMYLDVHGEVTCISFLRPLLDNALRELNLTISTQSFSVKFH